MKTPAISTSSRHPAKISIGNLYRVLEEVLLSTTNETPALDPDPIPINLLLRQTLQNKSYLELGKRQRFDHLKKVVSMLQAQLDPWFTRVQGLVTDHEVLEEIRCQVAKIYQAQAANL